MLKIFLKNKLVLFLLDLFVLDKVDEVSVNIRKYQKKLDIWKIAYLIFAKHIKSKIKYP